MKTNDKTFLKGSENEMNSKMTNSNNNNNNPNSLSNAFDEKFKAKKAVTASSNSLASIPHSEDYSTASGLGRELKKKIKSKYVYLYDTCLKNKFY